MFVIITFYKIMFKNQKNNIACQINGGVQSFEINVLSAHLMSDYSALYIVSSECVQHTTLYCQQ